MFTKEWIAQFDNHTIRVVNAWNTTETREEVYIDNVLVRNNKKDMMTVSWHSATGERFNIKYNGHTIEVRVGSAWHLLGTACKIIVDGKYVGGDRIVFFVPKAGSIESEL